MNEFVARRTQQAEAKIAFAEAQAAADVRAAAADLSAKAAEIVLRGETQGAVGADLVEPRDLPAQGSPELGATGLPRLRAKP